MVQPIESINIRRTVNGLTWGESNNTQSVTFEKEAFAVIAFELLEEQYGATRISAEYCYLTVKQAFNFIEKKYPAAFQDSNMRIRSDWLRLRQQLCPVSQVTIKLKDLPADFDEVLIKALSFMERQYFRSQSQVNTPPRSSNANDVELPALLIPYNLSRLTTFEQKNRFEYVYKNKPTIQKLVEHFNLKSAGTWRQYVRASINPHLTDCQIKHNHEQCVWEVVSVAVDSGVMHS